MLSCATRNQIFRCSLLPLSLMCECWIAKFTVRCPLWCGTQESTAVSALTPVRGDKCLSFRKVYPRTRINSSERVLACVLIQQASLRLMEKHFIFTYSGVSLWVTVLQSHIFHSGAVSRGTFVFLKHMIQICRCQNARRSSTFKSVRVNKRTLDHFLFVKQAKMMMLMMTTVRKAEP